MDPEQTAPIGAVCSGPMEFASILNLSVMLGNYLQQTTSADDIFRCIFFLALQGLAHMWSVPKSHELVKMIVQCCPFITYLNITAVSYCGSKKLPPNFT